MRNREWLAQLLEAFIVAWRSGDPASAEAMSILRSCQDVFAIEYGSAYTYGETIGRALGRWAKGIEIDDESERGIQRCIAALRGEKKSE